MLTGTTRVPSDARSPKPKRASPAPVDASGSPSHGSRVRPGLQEQLSILLEVQRLDGDLILLTRGGTESQEAVRQKDFQLARVRERIKEKQGYLDVQLRLEKNRATVELESARERLILIQGAVEVTVDQGQNRKLGREIRHLQDQERRLEISLNAAEGSLKKVDAEIKSLFEVAATLEMELTTARHTEAAPAAPKPNLGSLQERRSQLAAQVPQPLLAGYERIRAARNGVGISRAERGRCLACNMTIPAQTWNDLLRSSVVIHQCPSCLRMLVRLPVAP